MQKRPLDGFKIPLSRNVFFEHQLPSANQLFQFHLVGEKMISEMVRISGIGLKIKKNSVSQVPQEGRGSVLAHRCFF